MSNDITLELDVVDPQEGPWESEGMGALGAVYVEVAAPVGPAGHPICHVSGSEAAVLVWLLREYVNGNLDQALELLQVPADGNGGARVAG